MIEGWTTRTRTVLRALRRGELHALRATLERGVFPASLFRRNSLLIASLDAPLPPSRFLPGFCLRWASRRDVAALTCVKNRPSEFNDFFCRGYLCLIGELDREPVSFSWLELDQDHVSRPNAYRFVLGPGAAWAFGLELRRGYETRGLFHLHWYEKMKRLRRGGVERVFLAIQGDCAASRLQHARVGFAPEIRLELLRLCGLTLHRDVCVSSLGAASRVRLGRWQGRSRRYALS